VGADGRHGRRQCERCNLVHTGRDCYQASAPTRYREGVSKLVRLRGRCFSFAFGARYRALRYSGHVEVGKQKDGGMHAERLGEHERSLAAQLSCTRFERR
jgi:hypothetical protein